MTGVISRIDIHQIHLSHDVWLGGGLDPQRWKNLQKT